MSFHLLRFIIFINIVFFAHTICGQHHSREDNSPYSAMAKHYSIGTEYLDEYQYDSAVFHYKIAHEYLLNLPDSITANLTPHVPFLANFFLGEALFGANSYKEAEEYYLNAIQILRTQNFDDILDDYLCEAYNSLIKNYERQEKLGWVQFYSDKIKDCDDLFFAINGHILTVTHELKNRNYEAAELALIEAEKIIRRYPESADRYIQMIVLKYNQVMLSEKTMSQTKFLNFYEETSQFFHDIKDIIPLDNYIDIMEDMIIIGGKYNQDLSGHRVLVNEFLAMNQEEISSYDYLQGLIADYTFLIIDGKYDDAIARIFKIIDYDDDNQLSEADLDLFEQKELFIKMYEDILHLELLKIQSGKNISKFEDVIPLIDGYFRFSDIYMQGSSLISSRLSYLNYFESPFSHIKEILLYHYLNNPGSLSLPTLWEYNEKMKGNLFDYLKREHNLLHNQNLPAEKEKEFRDLRQKLIFYQNQIPRSTDPDEISDYKFNFNTTIRSINKLLKSSELDLNEIDQRKLSLEDLMQYNREHNSLTLEYSISENFLYVFLIDKNDISLAIKEISKDSIQQLSKEYSKLLKFGEYTGLNKQEYKDHLQNFHQLSYKLYSLFLEPFEDKLLPKVRIIADPLMQSVPFETLCMNKELKKYSFSHLDYAIKKYTFHYNSFNSINPGIAPKENKNILSIIPNYTENSVYRNLGARMSEYNYFKNNSNATIWTGKEASPQHLMENWADYSIINFTGHASSETDRLVSPFLLLNSDSAGNTKLFMEDIQYNKLNARLVFLNACSTQEGEQHFSEGLLGLQRAFFLADATSIISSLWPVSDKESALIIKETYDGIESGLAVDEALRNAKLNHILNEDPILSIPYYWAAMTLHGEALYANQVLNIPSFKSSKLLIPSGIALAGIILFFLIRRLSR